MTNRSDSAGGSQIVERALLRVSRLTPRFWAATLLLLILVNGVVLSWRWAASRATAPKDYYTYQVQRWEQQLLDNPDDPLVWTTLAGLYGEMGDERKALDAYEEALSLDPKNPAALLFLGKRAAQEGDVSEARGLIQRSAEGLPQGGRYLAYFELGELERLAGNDDAAIAAYALSIEDRTSFWNAHYQLAFLYERQGRLDDALASAQRAKASVGQRADLDELIESLLADGAEASASPTSTPEIGAE